MTAPTRWQDQPTPNSSDFTILATNGWLTLGQIAATTDAELLSARGFGPVRLARVRATVAALAPPSKHTQQQPAPKKERTPLVTIPRPPRLVELSPAAATRLRRIDAMFGRKVRRSMGGIGRTKGSGVAVLAPADLPVPAKMLYTLVEVAGLLSTSRSTVIRLVESGELRLITGAGQVRRCTRGELIRWIRLHAHETDPIEDPAPPAVLVGEGRAREMLGGIDRHMLQSLVKSGDIPVIRLGQRMMYDSGKGELVARSGRNLFPVAGLVALGDRWTEDGFVDIPADVRELRARQQEKYLARRVEAESRKVAQ